MNYKYNLGALDIVLYYGVNQSDCLAFKPLEDIYDVYLLAILNISEKNKKNTAYLEC